MSVNTLNQNPPFTATELLEFANLQIAAEALYGLLASVGWATCCPRVLMNFQAA
ncbi:MAG: hypothetical protein IKI11_01815 [Neisseriaceae bacterium]|nr:hypothetical protein [Neisseriaceae bacterium]